MHHAVAGLATLLTAADVQAFEVGRQVAAAVSSAFQEPMELKLERVCRPFLLLHVNRSPIPSEPLTARPVFCKARAALWEWMLSGGVAWSEDRYAAGMRAKALRARTSWAEAPC